MEFVEIKRKWNLANSTTVNWTDLKVISKLTVNDFMNITEFFCLLSNKSKNLCNGVPSPHDFFYLVHYFRKRLGRPKFKFLLLFFWVVLITQTRLNLMYE